MQRFHTFSAVSNLSPSTLVAHALFLQATRARKVGRSRKTPPGHVAESSVARVGSRTPGTGYPVRLISFAHAGARCHATCQHCSRDEAPRHPRRWLVPLLLRVGSSRRATSGTSTAFISNRADPTAWWWLICRVNGAVLAAPSRRQCVAMSRKNNTA